MGWDEAPPWFGVSVEHAMVGAPEERASPSLTPSKRTRQSQATATNDAIVPDFAQHYDMGYIIATMLLYKILLFAFIERPSGRNKKRHAMNTCIYINNDCIA